MAINLNRTISGDVVIKGTEFGVQGLVAMGVAIHPQGLEASIGSAPVARGRFRIAYRGEAPNSDGQQAPRPDIKVKILAPSMGAADPKILIESEIRKAAAPDEYFLLAIDAATLADEGMASSVAAAARSGSADVAAKMVELTRTRENDRRAKIVAERKISVEEFRSREESRRKAIHTKLLSHLTRVAPGSEPWTRMVAPGDSAIGVTKSYHAAALKPAEDGDDSTAGPVARVLAKQAARTYLALSDAEFALLGAAPEAAEIERRLARAGRADMVRIDPLGQCRTIHDENVRPTEPSTPPSGGPATSAGPQSVDQKVEALIGAINPPDALQIEGPMNAQQVGSKVMGLNLAKGPADVPAYYDFHRLELAFDHIWEDARAAGYIERGEALFMAAEDLGGDPAKALGESGSPMAALRREVRLAARATAATTAPGSVPGYIARFKNPRSSLDISTTGLIDPGDFEPLPPLSPHPDPPPGGGDDRWPWGAVNVDPLDILPVSDSGEGPGGDGTGTDGGYPFTVFAPGSINFGLLVTYQQCFEPSNYQVGRLVGTRTLGPKETYSFTTKQVLKRSFNRKQVEANQQMRRSESETSYRDEAEIVNRAQTKTNFALSTSGSYDLGPLGEGTATTSLGRDAESSSQETKRAQRSAIQRVAQEARNEQRMELESTTTIETETTERREIFNPNDELALTCVFYELQRRYRLSEKLHRVTPVLMVAQKVPRPEEINDDWVVRHDWILRRFLPDDSFVSALTYLATSAAGDAVVLADLEDHMRKLRAAVEQLTSQILTVRKSAAQQLAELQRYVNLKSQRANEDNSEGWFEGAWEAVAGSSDGQSQEAIRILEEAARERYERAVRDEQNLNTRLDREATALQVATDTYVKALAEHRNRRTEVDRLVNHVRDFILHYMQGIWSYEHPDQRFFRHHTMTAPRLEPVERNYHLEPLDDWPVGVTPEAGKKCYEVTFTTSIDPNKVESDRATLAELADLDRMLGFKGNYIIYPLKESNGLTDYMMMPYVDPELGVRDPDDVGNWTLEEFNEYVECLRRKLSEDDFHEIESDLEKQRKKLLTSPRRSGEYVVIPSNSLYMQMLVDSGKALEQFKEAHRLMDIMKVKAEVRAAELDNLRRAKLVLDNQLGDPNIESVKNVYYHGPAPHDGDE